jgi:hypothetical protein
VVGRDHRRHFWLLRCLVLIHSFQNGTSAKVG